MPATLNRAQLIEQLAGGEAPEQAALVVETALARLGWASKDAFDRADTLALTRAIAALAVESLASAPSPGDRQVAAGLRLILEADQAPPG